MTIPSTEVQYPMTFDEMSALLGKIFKMNNGSVSVKHGPEENGGKWKIALRTTVYVAGWSSFNNSDVELDGNEVWDQKSLRLKLQTHLDALDAIPEMVREMLYLPPQG